MEPLAGQSQIPRPAVNRTFGLLVALLVTAETIEVVFGNELLCGVDIIGWDRLIIEVHIGDFDSGKPVEKIDQLIRVFIGETERRHAQFKPRTNRHRRFQEAEKPIRLNLLAFTVENRRRQSWILLIILPNVSAALFDLMTAYTIVLLHQAASFDDLLDAQSLIRLIAFTDSALTESGQQNA